MDDVKGKSRSIDLKQAEGLGLGLNVVNNIIQVDFVYVYMTIRTSYPALCVCMSWICVWVLDMAVS